MVLSNFAYSSTLAPDCNSTCVADIIKVARHFNPTHGITGLLVFDGQHFFQYIEGPDAPLQQLVAAIAQDRRHVQFTPRLASRCTERLFTQWSMAYVQVDEESSCGPWNALQAALPSTLLHKLQDMLPLLDIA